MSRRGWVAIAYAAVPGLVLAAHLPARAGARVPIVDSDPVTQAVARAIEYWGAAPCAGQVLIVSGAPAEAHAAGLNWHGRANEAAAMWATWDTPDGVNSFNALPASFTDCVVHLNGGVWPTWVADDRRFPVFCKQIVHEYGHLEGHPDVGAALGSVEYERPDLARVPACERYRLVYGHRTYEARPTRSRTTRVK